LPYLVKKYSRQFGKLPPLSAADYASLELAGCPALLKPKERKQLTAAGGFVAAGKLLAGPQKQHLVEVLNGN
jgi:hypothetical protein